MSIQALREQRAAKAKTLNELVNKADWSAAADQPIYDQGLAELDDLDGRIARINEINARVANEALTEQGVERSNRLARDSGSEGARVFSKWLRGGDNSLTAQDWDVVRATMSTTTNTEGGYTVSTDVATTVLDALKAYGGMRSVANVLQTLSGNPINFPTSDGTSEEGEIVAENGTASDDDIDFGVKSLATYKYSSKVVPVPVELLQDSAIDVEALVRSRLVTRLGRITNKHFTTGTGSSQPNGVVTAAGVGYTASNSTSQVTAVKHDSLVELQHSVDPAYRQLGNCKFMMNDATLKEIRKIVDGQSRPIFAPGYEQGNPGGAPDTILGAPVVINQSVATMAASAKSILFGDFSFYTIRDVMAVELQRYTDSAYAKKGQVGFLAWMRCGGNLLDVGGAVKVFVNAAS